METLTKEELEVLMTLLANASVTVKDSPRLVALLEKMQRMYKAHE